VTLHDDLGAPVATAGSAQRVVSLVPSLTESVAATRPEVLIGATDWCTHPAGLEVVRVRGTKNPDIATIAKLKPDLVLANKEENRELDIRRIRAAGIPVWVTDIVSVPQALDSLQRLFGEALGVTPPDWLNEARCVWSDPAPTVRARTVIPIWRDPWMVVGRDTFAGDLVRRLGLDNVYAAHPRRYPRLELSEIDRSDIDLVILPDEPYPFSYDDGPEAFHHSKLALVSGRLLAWYGPSLVEARQQLNAAIQVAFEGS
jgi:ABC-type Fe3+-hydroxamate transport system substrate-binding protein